MERACVLEAKETRASMTDFDRYKLRTAKHKRAKAVKLAPRIALT